MVLSPTIDQMGLVKIELDSLAVTATKTDTISAKVGIALRAEYYDENWATWEMLMENWPITVSVD
jgi:hypothetical protein